MVTDAAGTVEAVFEKKLHPKGGTVLMSITGENIRNIAVIGHSGEGKTTLCEAMLFNGGATGRQG